MSADTDWQPAASVERLQLRARMRARVREFFAARGVLEVDTPVLSAAAATDPHIHSLATRVAGDTGPRFLHTSPEFPMKRLLAAGVGDCWQLARVFRDGEHGRLHNPEFDLLEWYRLGFDDAALMDEVAALVAVVVGPERPVPSPLRLSYRDAFLELAGVDPLAADAAALRAAGRGAGVEPPCGLDPADRDGWLDHLLAVRVVPSLPAGRLVFVHHWPAAQAALARFEPDDPRVARRFELYWDGLELANGYHELADPAEQRRRFEADRERRRRVGAADVPPDGHLLAALDAGLPECAGVALGFDRLVMRAAGADALEAVLAFPFGRA